METQEDTIMKNPSVCDLRRAGYKIRILHSRYVAIKSEINQEEYYLDLQSIKTIRERDGNLSRVMSKGGKTEIHVTAPDGRNSEAVARCNLSDAFDRRLALKIGIGRALKCLE